MDINNYIFDKRIRLIVKANSPETGIAGFDEARKALKLNVHSQPKKGKANAEIIKFFSKLLKKKVRIVSGLASKEKVLEVL